MIGRLMLKACYREELNKADVNCGWFRNCKVGCWMAKVNVECGGAGGGLDV